jgi:hypothetical protein
MNGPTPSCEVQAPLNLCWAVWITPTTGVPFPNRADREPENWPEIGQARRSPGCRHRTQRGEILPFQAPFQLPGNSIPTSPFLERGEAPGLKIRQFVLALAFVSVLALHLQHVLWLEPSKRQV